MLQKLYIKSPRNVGKGLGLFFAVESLDLISGPVSRISVALKVRDREEVWIDCRTRLGVVQHACRG